MLYVEELIGRDTVNTVPPATLDAFRDHGKLRDSLEEDVDEATARAGRAGQGRISLDAITEELVDEGVKLFAEAADKLLGAVAQKRATMLGAAIGSQKLSLGAGIERAVEKRTDEWPAAASSASCGAATRSVWTGDDEAKWLGWLDSPAQGRAIADYEDYARRVKGRLHRRRGARHGRIEPRARSAGRDVSEEVGLSETAHARLHRPGAGRARRKASISSRRCSSSPASPAAPPSRTCSRLISSRRCRKPSGDKAGHHFVAVTDPGSAMEKVATTHGFPRMFSAIPAIGGRYSVLSPFGIVPAAPQASICAACSSHAGDGPLLRRGRAAAGKSRRPAGPRNGTAGARGRDKVTIFSSEADRGFRRMGSNS